MLLLKDYDSNKLIFLGMQGTGKTAGMIAETAGFLQNRIHLPVIVHAKAMCLRDSKKNCLER